MAVFSQGVSRKFLSGVTGLLGVIGDAVWYGSWFFDTTQAMPDAPTLEAATSPGAAPENDFLQALTLTCFPKRAVLPPDATRPTKAAYHLARFLGLILGLGVGLRHVVYYGLFIPAYAFVFGPGNVYGRKHLREMGFYCEKKAGKKTYPWYLRVLGVLFLGGVVTWWITASIILSHVAAASWAAMKWIGRSLKAMCPHVQDWWHALDIRRSLKSACRWVITHKVQTVWLLLKWAVSPLLALATGAIKSPRWLRNLLSRSRWKKDTQHQYWSAFALLWVVGVAACVPVGLPWAIVAGLMAGGYVQIAKNKVKKSYDLHKFLPRDAFDTVYYKEENGSREPYSKNGLLGSVRRNEGLFTMSDPLFRSLRHVDLLNWSAENQLKQTKVGEDLTPKAVAAVAALKPLLQR